MDAVAATVEKKAHVIFIPLPAQSHVKAMLKLARLLHNKGIDITFVNTEPNHNRLLKYSGTGCLENAPGFQFQTIPLDVGLPQTFDHFWINLKTNFLASFLDLVDRLDTPVTCIISDGFMAGANTIYAAEKLKIPIILHWTVAACGFMGFYQAQVLNKKGIVPLKDESYLTNGYLDTAIDWIPGMEGFLLKDLPHYVRNTKQDDIMFNFVLENVQAADKVSHMIIHTFEELEAKLIKVLKRMFPQIYTVGPLQLHLNQMTEKDTNKSNFNGYSLWEEEPECVQWLKTKEPKSVVYVNFGSVAVMSLKDLLEFGWGLANSNHYFLWIIRDDLVDGEPIVLPPELEDMIKTKGFVASWCSQEEVLNHPSVGGFLTHGGWGSIIESLSAGVPMICWPIVWEQTTNCKQLCKEWEAGMEIGRDVKRDEVEKLVRELMEGVEGKRMRNKAMEWKKTAEIATGPNGSSSSDIEKLVNEIAKFSRK